MYGIKKEKRFIRFLSDVATAMFLWLVIYAGLLCIPEAAAQERNSVEGVQRAISHLLSTSPRRPLARDIKQQNQLASDIVNACKKWDVPPLLLTTIAFRESSFKTSANGKIGEKGLTQVHGVAARGCDLTTQIGQLECGAKWLSKSYASCGMDWSKALSAYACGSCSPRNDRVLWLVASRMKLWRSLENLSR